jgi:hypothetical protein
MTLFDVEGMSFGPALPRDFDQPRRLKHFKVLRDSLSCERLTVFSHRSAANLKQRLILTFAEIVNDAPPGPIRECLENEIEFIVIHASICSNFTAYSSAAFLARIETPHSLSCLTIEANKLHFKKTR